MLHALVTAEKVAQGWSRLGSAAESLILSRTPPPHEARSSDASPRTRAAQHVGSSSDSEAPARCAPLSARPPFSSSPGPQNSLWLSADAAACRSTPAPPLQTSPRGPEPPRLSARRLSVEVDVSRAASVRPMQPSASSGTLCALAQPVTSPPSISLASVDGNAASTCSAGAFSVRTLAVPAPSAPTGPAPSAPPRRTRSSYSSVGGPRSYGGAGDRDEPTSRCTDGSCRRAACSEVGIACSADASRSSSRLPSTTAMTMRRLPFSMSALGHLAMNGIMVTASGIVPSSLSTADFSGPSAGVRRAPSQGAKEDYRYSMVRLQDLGEGASGFVRKAIHLPTMTLIAAKAIPIFDKERSHAVALELRALTENFVPLQQLGSDCLRPNQHAPCPYIVSFYDAYTDEREGVLTFMLEYMDGGSLEQIQGCSSESVLAHVSYSVLRALNFLHCRGYLHRDIKPSNILINHLGDVKLADFGIVCRLGGSSDVALPDGASGSGTSSEGTEPDAHRFVGSCAYMSPERLCGKAYGTSSEVWSLGLTILATALGRHPFSELNGYWEQLNFFENESIPLLGPHNLPPGSSSAFLDFISACVKRDPAERLSVAALLAHPFLAKVALRHALASQKAKDASLAADAPPEPQVLASALPVASGLPPPPSDAVLSAHAPVQRVPMKADESHSGNISAMEDLKDIYQKVQFFRFKCALVNRQKVLDIIVPNLFRWLAHQLGLPAEYVASAFNTEQKHFNRQLRKLRCIRRSEGQ